MSLRNRIAARVLDAVIARVPFFETAKLNDYPNKPDVWGHVILDEVTGEPYLTRVLFPRIPARVPVIGGVRPTLHKFHRPDNDRAIHNHPWKWAVSFILAGEYVEEKLAIDESNLKRRPVTEHRLVRWVNYLTRQDWHRITELRGEVYTLFCMGPRLSEDDVASSEMGDWGFMDMDTGETINWRRFLDLKLLASRAGREAIERLAKRYGVTLPDGVDIRDTAGLLMAAIRVCGHH